MRPSTKPSFLKTLRLKCPYCGTTPLTAVGNPLAFRDGCLTCNYKYEREVGYFSGASWMITYTVAALSAMFVGAIMVWKFSDRGDFIVAGVPGLFGLAMSILFIPYGRALWMYGDHLFHPLTPFDDLVGMK